MKKRKYPMSVFIMGTILNLFRMWYGFVPVIISFIVCMVEPSVSIMIPLGILGIMIAIAVIQQLKNRKILLLFDGDEKLMNCLIKCLPITQKDTETE